MTDGWGISCKIALRWMPLDLTDDMSTLVQVMVWCCQATSHYLSQSWPRSLLPYGITRPQWVKKSDIPTHPIWSRFCTCSVTMACAKLLSDVIIIFFSKSKVYFDKINELRNGLSDGSWKSSQISGGGYNNYSQEFLWWENLILYKSW